MRRDVFVAGGTGYIGSRLLPLLLSRGHRVRALARPGSERKLPAGLVTIGQLLSALVFAVESPARGIRILEVPGLRAAKI